MINATDPFLQITLTRHDDHSPSKHTLPLIEDETDNRQLDRSESRV